MTTANPFNPFVLDASHWGMDTVEVINAQDRIDLIGRFCAFECEQVLALEGVQKTVREAAERRLRKINRARR